MSFMMGFVRFQQRQQGLRAGVRRTPCLQRLAACQRIVRDHDYDTFIYIYIMKSVRFLVDLT